MLFINKYLNKNKMRKCNKNDNKDVNIAFKKITGYKAKCPKQEKLSTKSNLGMPYNTNETKQHVFIVDNKTVICLKYEIFCLNDLK